MSEKTYEIIGAYGKHDVIIHKVKRTRDGEVFTVGDLVTYNDSPGWIIKNLSINSDGDMMMAAAGRLDDPWCNIDHSQFRLVNKKEKMTEKILEESQDRFVAFPIQHPVLWDFYQFEQKAFWTEHEIDLSDDIKDWNALDENTQFFIKNVLSFFAASDGIVNENLAINFLNEVQYFEAKAFYGFQIAMENVHSTVYSLLIDTYIKDPIERDRCLKAIQYLPPVTKKAEWALKWIESESFTDRLIAFVAVEGIFFSGSFCSIFWLKKRGLMPGLCFANSLINRDENLHCDFAIELLINHIENKPSEERIKEILLDAVAIEKEFITESLPVSLIGMNNELMSQYIEFITDGLLVKLGCKKHFNTANPFKWMEQLAMDVKGNFFEKKVGEYQKANTGEQIIISEDF